METLNTEQFLNDYGLSVVANIIAKLRNSNKVASGKLLNSLKEEVVENINLLELKIKGESYFQNVVDGRKPGAYPPLGPLYQWARIKGIPKEAVFPIARSIYKFGIEPDPAFARLNEELVSGLKTGVEKSMSEDIKQELRSIKTNIEKS
jgi:hypothetical protein